MQPRNTNDRDILKKSITEPINLRGFEGSRILSSTTVNETILLSDILEINEFQALDLLVTGRNIFTFTSFIFLLGITSFLL